MMTGSLPTYMLNLECPGATKYTRLLCPSVGVLVTFFYLHLVKISPIITTLYVHSFNLVMTLGQHQVSLSGQHIAYFEENLKILLLMFYNNMYGK